MSEIALPTLLSTDEVAERYGCDARAAAACSTRRGAGGRVPRSANARSSASCTVYPSGRSDTNRSSLTRLAAAGRASPPRLALEQQDPVRAVARQSGYGEEAVDLAFRARYSDQSPERARHQPPDLGRPKSLGVEW